VLLLLRYASCAGVANTAKELMQLNAPDKATVPP
jgi:hypothetical protein